MLQLAVVLGASWRLMQTRSGRRPLLAWLAASQAQSGSNSSSSSQRNEPAQRLCYCAAASPARKLRPQSADRAAAAAKIHAHSIVCNSAAQLASYSAVRGGGLQSKPCLARLQLQRSGNTAPCPAPGASHMFRRSVSGSLELAPS